MKQFYLATLGLVLWSCSTAFGQVRLQSYSTPSYFQFGEPAYQVAEADRSLDVTVRRTGDFRQTASVSFRAVDDTALAGEDYEAATRTLIFPAGQSSISLDLRIIHDALVESTETLRLELFAPSSNGRVVEPTAIVSIHNSTLTSLSNPRLVVSFTNGAINVSWPDSGTTCQLEKTESLSAPLWNPVSDAPVLRNGQWHVTQPAGGPQNFYRLCVDPFSGSGG